MVESYIDGITNLTKKAQRIIDLYKDIYPPEELHEEDVELTRAIAEALAIKRYFMHLPLEFTEPLSKSLRYKLLELKLMNSKRSGDNQDVP